MKRLRLHTDLKQYSGNIQVKPDVPLFHFINDGGLPVYINDNFRLMPQQRLSINMPNLCARFIKKGYTITCDNEFSIHWERPLTFIESGLTVLGYALYLVAYALNRRLSFQHTKYTVE